MKVKKLRLISLIFAVSLFLTGCGPDPLYEMTDAEKDLIIHGAATVLAKHNIKQTDGISSRIPTADELVEPVESTEIEDDPVNQINLNEPGIEGLISIQEAMGQARLDIKFNGTIVQESYQEGSYYLVPPKDGCKYVIMSYNLRNPYIDPVSVDAFSVGPVFYANFGDGNYIKNESTFLTYSVPTYKGTLTAGESVDLVLIFSVEDTFDENNTARTMKVEVGGKKYYVEI